MQSVYGKYNNLDKAKELLKSEHLVPMVTLVVCCDMLTKGACFAWDIDTTLDELEAEECLPPAKGRDRLLAGLAALANPAYLWESSAFMCMSQTINGNVAIPHIWEPLSPAQIAYSVNELNALNQLYNNASGIEVLFGEEPRIYMAGCLRDSGIPTCPEELTLCSDQLERFYELPKSIEDSLANPVLKRKLDEISVFVNTMSKLRAKKMAELLR
jgi:hypothetical protein